MAKKRSRTPGKNDTITQVKKHAPLVLAVIGGALLARSLGAAWDSLAGDKISEKVEKMTNKSTTTDEGAV